MRCDILSLLLYSRGRDVEIIEPILVNLESQHNIHVIRADAFCYGYYLLYYRPRVLLLPNTVGSDYYYYAAKLASHLGISVISLVSEGAIPKRESVNVNDFLTAFWGVNKDCVLYEDLNLVWNKNGYDFARQMLSDEDMNKIKISGASLFDKYAIFSNTFNKDRYLARKGLKQYSKVALITTWTFSTLYGGYMERNKDVETKILGGEKWVDFHKKNAFLLREIYKQLIKKYSDVLFIVKQHPAELDCDEHNYEKSEYYSLDKYDNVHFVEPYTDDIMELIGISDVVLSYESTTGMEAWLMDTPVIFINPVLVDFPRSNFYKGVVIAVDYDMVDALLNEVFTTGRLKAFDEKKDIQQTISRDIMTYTDGKNHIRAAEQILHYLGEKHCKKIDISLWDIKEIFKSFIKKMLRYHSAQDIYDIDERQSITKMYEEGLVDFYKNNDYNI